MESVASADEPHSRFTDLGDDATVCDARAIRNALVSTYHIANFETMYIHNEVITKVMLISCMYVCTYIHNINVINTYYHTGNHSNHTCNNNHNYTDDVSSCGLIS